MCCDWKLALEMRSLCKGLHTEIQLLLCVARFAKPQQKRGVKFSRTCFQGQEWQSIISDFQENGVVCIRKLFDENWQKIVDKGIEKSFSNPSKHCDWVVGDNGNGVYFNDYMKWDKIAEFKKFVLQSPAAKIAGLLMQSQVCLTLSFIRPLYTDFLPVTILLRFQMLLDLLLFWPCKV